MVSDAITIKPYFMKNSKALLGFAKLSDANIETKAVSIVTAMTGNANFTTPVPALADVSKAIQDYSQALAMAQMGDKLQVAIKNAKKEALLTLLRSLAAYVNFTANGDKTVIISSGFDASKESGSAQSLLAPKNFKITNGMNPGQAITSISGVRGVKTYMHQYTVDPITDASVWKSEYVTTRSYTFNSMDSGKKFWFRVAVIGTGGQIAYTDPLSLIIQ